MVILKCQSSAKKKKLRSFYSSKCRLSVLFFLGTIVHIAFGTGIIVGTISGTEVNTIATGTCINSLGTVVNICPAY